MSLFRVALGSALALCLGAAARAQSFAVGGSLGTPGLGVEAQAKVADWIVLRAAGDFAEFDLDEEYGGIAYAGKMKLRTAGAFVDLHPGGEGFLFTVGAYFGERRGELDGQPTGNVDIGGVSYTPAQVGRIDGDIEMGKTQPFVGIGYDTTFTRAGAVGFKGVLGVAFSDSPQVNLTASGGSLSGNATFLESVRREESEVREDARNFRYFPVAQLGLNYRF